LDADINIAPLEGSSFSKSIQFSSTTGMAGYKSDKFERDVRLLEEGLKQNPENERAYCCKQEEPTPNPPTGSSSRRTSTAESSSTSGKSSATASKKVQPREKTQRFQTSKNRSQKRGG
jgi:hypothetical protein